MNLLLLRHGEAIPADDRGDDTRPLTPKGRRQIRVVGRWLVRREEPVNLIVVSPLVRARETATTLRLIWGTEAREIFSGSLRPETPPAESWRGLRSILHRTGRPDSVMCIGHEPCLSRLGAWLLTGTEHLELTLKKGGLIQLELPSGRITPGRGVTLKALVTPGMIGRSFMTA